MLDLSKRKRLTKDLEACPGGCSGGTLPLYASHNKWLSLLVVDRISIQVYLKGIWEIACDGIRKDSWEITWGYCGTWLSRGYCGTWLSRGTVALGCQGGTVELGYHGGTVALGYQGGTVALGYQGGTVALGYQGGSVALGY